MDVSLIVFIGLTVLVASSGAMFKPGDWYETLNKPSWRPPNWAFPVVWTVLYVLITWAAWRVWTTAPREALPLAMGLYGLQLALNAGWSAIFFGMKRMKLALLELGALWLSIVALIAVFWPLDRTAALMLVPYLVWVTTAGVLNRAMIRLNPEAEPARA